MLLSRNEARAPRERNWDGGGGRVPARCAFARKMIRRCACMHACMHAAATRRHAALRAGEYSHVTAEDGLRVGDQLPSRSALAAL